jgi:tetratricopeptide (TPR) repeat protein
MPPEALLQAAIERRALGDVTGARERLQVLEEGGATPALAAYHLAVCDEVEEDYVGALAGYTTLIDRWPDLPLADDARYRRAIVLEDLGEHQQAVAQVRELLHRGAWDERDRASLALIRGAAELDAGRLRPGVRRVQRELAALEGTEDLTWARARARLALTRALLDQAAAVEIVNDGRARKRLVARVALLDQAMDQVIRIGHLGEPEAALAGLLALGDAYQALHADLLAAPPPRGLTEEQVTIFRQELVPQVDVLQVKAWRFYDEGVSLATRLQWQGRIAQELKERRAALSPPR